MSETVNYTGTLKRLDFNSLEEIENIAQEIIRGRGNKDEFPSYFDHYWEWLESEYENEFFYINGSLYQALKCEEIDMDTDQFKANRNQDGSIDFNVRYYNGGCSLGEALETAIKKLENKL